MKRKERTKILVHCSGDFLEKWSKYFEEIEKFVIVEAPANCLTMIKMRESAQNSIFYLAEMLVSEARVDCKGCIGIGILQGTDLEKAYHLAVIDAAYEAEVEGIDQFEKALLEQKSIIDEKSRESVNGVLKTKVSFETMSI